jgi:Flp pilus assembly protein TadG
MKQLAFFRSASPTQRNGERGVTMVLVAMAMVAIIAMAALSIDVITLYLAREEAQRAADAGALAAARVISISGITGTADPDNDAISWTTMCGGNTSVATVTAKAVAQQNSVGGSAATNVTVTYSDGSGASNSDCTNVPNDNHFGVNPLVTVQVTRDSLPTLFSRIWSRATNTVSASATAEAFNPSNSGSFAGGDVIPVTPRCAKPWIIPNADPGSSGGNFVSRTNGAIQNHSIVLGGTGAGIGERFTLANACSGTDCSGMEGSTPGSGNYIPASITPSAIAVPPSCASNDYQNAITGCDGSTVYACGASGVAQADLTVNPGADTAAAVQCMIHQANQDTLDVSSYPFQIKAGAGNLIAPSNQVITSSNSIVSLPIYDSRSNLPAGVSKPSVAIVGFLQVFINSVDANGNMDVYILNVAGCGNDASTTRAAPGTSPVPIRLITPQ